MKDLIKFYLEILNQQVGHFQINDYKKFLKQSFKFNENGLLLEDKHLLIDVPNEAIQYVLENCNSLLNADKFKSTFKQSKHWRNIKNINFGQIYFGVFSFENRLEINQFHIKCFNFDEDKLQNNYDDFKTYCSSLAGFYNSIENKHVICVNSKSKNVIQTLYHQLSHFIQNIGNVRITTSTLNQKQTQMIHDDILNRNLSNKMISYFSGTQYSTHIDDMIIDLKRMKEKFYKDNNFQFFHDLTKFLNTSKKLTYNEILKEQFFQKFLKANSDDYTSLIMLCYSFKAGFKSQKIFNILHNAILKIK